MESYIKKEVQSLNNDIVMEAGIIGFNGIIGSTVAIATAAVAWAGAEHVITTGAVLSDATGLSILIACGIGSTAFFTNKGYQSYKAIQELNNTRHAIRTMKPF